MLSSHGPALRDCSLLGYGFARDSEPKWIRVSSAHFAVLTDAGEKKGREVSLRLEQMREVFGQLFLKTKVQMPEPLDVIALQSDEEYIRVAPLRQGRPISAPGFFLPGGDRNYIVLDLAAEDSWRACLPRFCTAVSELQLSADPGLV